MSTDRIKDNFPDTCDFFQTIFESSPQPMWVYDLETMKFLAVNNATLDHYGYTHNEFLSMTIREIRPPEEVPRLVETISKIGIGVQHSRSWKHRGKDGSLMDVEISSHGTLFGGRKARFVIVQDVTERKKAEEKVRQSETKYRNLFESSTDGIFINDLAGNFIDVNATAYTRLGYTKEEMLAMHMSRLDLPEFAAHIPERIKQMRENGFAVFESAHRRKDGATMPVEVNARVMEYDGRPVFFSVIRDITERKQVEEALRESEKRYHILFDQSPDGILLLDTNGSILEFNDASHNQLGYTREEFARLRLSDIDPVESQEEIQFKIGKILEIGKAAFDVKHRTKQGEIRDVHIINQAMMLSGSPVVHTIWHDITERKTAEDKIRQNEQFIRKILDTVDEGFIVIDRDYRILTANKAFCGQVGNCIAGKVIGKYCYEVSHRTNRPCHEEGEDCAVRRAFETGNASSALHRHTDADGNILYVDTKAFPIKDASGAVTSVIETINNITERYLLEEERLKTQKLESIGILAGGIAHDFNNLLQGVFGYISMAKVTIDKKEESLAMLEEARKALDQSVHLTNQLLTFSRGGKPVKKRIELQPVIENSAKFTLSGSRSDMRLDLPKDLWQTEADEGQLGQVVQNIVLNADQAMPTGGTVSISATNIPEGDSSLPSGLVKGNYAAIAIQDTGVGIHDKYLSKIFDPYFTTKEKGSGLGLATSYSIIRNHGGMIDVRSKSGEGTTFLIYLPAIAGEAPKVSTISPPERSPQPSARVLVMDDGELIRALIRRMIGSLGHDVEVAEHGQEALEQYQKAIAEGKPFDIVILDLTIRGGMGGLETLQKLQEIDPAVKAIVSSGYSDDAATASYDKLGFKAFLKKPYDDGALTEALNKILMR